MDVLITYDIETIGRDGQRRLAKVARVCEQFGTRVQQSVFEARVSDVQLERLVIDLSDLVDAGADSINIYRLTGTVDDVRIELGRPPAHRLGQPWIL